MGLAPQVNSIEGAIAKLPGGDPCVYLNNAGTGVESVDQNSSPGECGKTGGQWIPPQPTGTTYGVSNGYAYPILPQDSSNRFFSEKTCFYMDWAGGYAAVVAIPNAENPVGWGLGVGGIGLWAVGKIGGC